MSEKMTYKVLKQEGRAKRAVMETVHDVLFQRSAEMFSGQTGSVLQL